MDSYLSSAIAECEQAIKAESDNPEDWQAAFRNLGNLLQGMAEFERAIIWHSLALESKLNLGEAYSQLGELHIQEKNWSAALTCFENALKYFSNSDRIYIALAQINGQLQRKDAEMDYWYRATQINPSLLNDSGYYKLGKAFEQKGKITEAIACYELATAGGEGVVAAFFALGEIYQRQGKLDLAQAIYEKILTAEATEARARYKLGTVYLQKRSFDRAIDCFRMAIEHNPDFPWAYRDLVKTFLILQRWDEAISTCYAILNLVGEYPWVYIHLGNALRERGRLSQAAKNFQKACEHRGWQQCVTNDYFFTIDVFSHRMSTWSEHLQPLIATAVNALEVGCYQGMSCCWTLDKVLTHENSRFTCIDNNLDPKLKENVLKTGLESKVTFLQGDSHQQMANCIPNSFDLINLQDRCKLSEHTEKNTMFAWKLLKPGGFIVFGYYGWRNPNDTRQNPREGIDRFLNTVKGQWKPVHLSPPAFQLIIRKL